MFRRRPSNWDRDPLLAGRDWDRIKQYWRQQQQPCARCGRPIDYDTTAPRYWASLDVGHITSRHEAKQQGWTREQINAVSNTQPEHQRCSRTAGVKQGNNNRNAKRPQQPTPIEHNEW